MKKVLLATFVFLNTVNLLAQTDPKATEVWQPEPKIVTPGPTPSDAPSDAIILFDGKNFRSMVVDR